MHKVKWDRWEKRSWRLQSEEEERAADEGYQHSLCTLWLPPVLQLECCFPGGGIMSGTEEAEWIPVWVFSPPTSWFLAAAGNTANISKQSLKLALCVLPVEFPVAHKLVSHPFAAGGGRHIRGKRSSKLGCSQQEGAQFHLLKALPI